MAPSSSSSSRTGIIARGNAARFSSTQEVAAGTVTLRERGGQRSVRSVAGATEWVKSLEAPSVE
jgi:hypothetical protein